MATADLIGIVITLIVVLFSMVVSVVITVLSFAVPVVVLIFVIRGLSTGRLVAIPVTGANGFMVVGAQGGRPHAAPGSSWVKRTTCQSCGSPKLQRSLSAYVYCDFCGELIDWDFQACLADKRSKLPGPVYEQLLAQHREALERAKASEDRATYQDIQRKLYDAYATHCPAALPPRVGDPKYRASLVDWLAASQTAQDLDPTCIVSFAEQTRLTAGLQWDRSNPFKPLARPDTFWPLMNAVHRHQRNAIAATEGAGLLERHPDRPTGDLLVRMGVSAMVQGWMPFLPADQIDRLLDETGLRDHFDELPVPELRSGPCPCCGAPIEVVPGAQRVVCHACGHLAGVGGGLMRCHGCASPIEVPQGTNLFACPRCDAELRMMRW